MIEKESHCFMILSLSDNLISLCVYIIRFIHILDIVMEKNNRILFWKDTKLTHSIQYETRMGQDKATVVECVWVLGADLFTLAVEVDERVAG